MFALLLLPPCQQQRVWAPIDERFGRGTTSIEPSSDSEPQVRGPFAYFGVGAYFGYSPFFLRLGVLVVSSSPGFMLKLPCVFSPLSFRLLSLFSLVTTKKLFRTGARESV